MKSVFVAVSAILLVCACGGTNGTGATTITIPTPPAPPTGLVPTQVVSPEGGGFSFGVLSDGMTTGQGYAQLLQTSFEAPPESGTATLDGTYSLSLVALNGGLTVRPSVGVNEAPLTLTADFGAGTLSGTDGTFTVDGTIASGLLTGSVTFQDVTTNQFRGVVGEDRAIGAFTGTTTSVILAGGFDVSR